MDKYDKQAHSAMKKWQISMRKSPSLTDKGTKGFQTRLNRMIPEKLHQLITDTIKKLTKGVLFGAGFTTNIPTINANLIDIESEVESRIDFYRSSAATEGAITGFGGFISGLADFPLWMTLKMKMLFEIAEHYGHDTRELNERIFMLRVFEITFSSQSNRNKVIKNISNWQIEKENLTKDINEFDWRTFQLEYRDHLDIAKLMQLVPGFGALVGAYVNHKYTKRLGEFAMNAYRMRRFNLKEISN